jgi:hypothetical protein
LNVLDLQDWRGVSAKDTDAGARHDVTKDKKIIKGTKPSHSWLWATTTLSMQKESRDVASQDA